ncbi:MAG TPA: hypothetical protein VK779_06255, partial [Rhizomicrobium sp.]|nr:hypothetical protein [Rhizomicrobium sp.]
MADIALAENYPDRARAQSLRRAGRGDERFRILTLASALIVVAIFLGVLVSLLRGAWPAIQEYGFTFLWTQKWNPVTEKFGA